jgi:hypothetical protein
VGRVGPLFDLGGPAWSLELQDSDEFLFGGGHYGQRHDCGFRCSSPFARGYMWRMSAPGTVDIARRPDGKVIGVGRSVHAQA